LIDYRSRLLIACSRIFNKMEKIETMILEGKYDRALLELATRDQADPRVLVESGRALAALGRSKEAADNFRQAADRYVVLSEQAAEQEKAATQATKQEESPQIMDESPTLVQPKYDWYQSQTHVFVSITAKKISKDELTLKVQSKSIELGVFNKFRLKLIPFALLNPEHSTHTLTEYRIELKLCKLVSGIWPQLEASEAQPPPVAQASATNAVPKPYASGKDWSKIEKEAVDPSEDDASGDPLNTLLKKIYKDADEDTRRAMMKSYQTSGGTVLTTNWGEAAKKDFAKEIKPPKGQVYKSWDGKVIANDEDNGE
jgi:suppressor of G2 allele of SKP1